MELIDRAYSTFTTRELERLTAYRLAVAAGSYTDWEGVEPAAPADAEDEVPPPEATGATPPEPER